MAGAEVTIRGLTRRFAGAARASLHELDLSIASGETVCLVGPSGCGKSTTLRLIAGLDRPDAGEILIDGRDVRHVEPQARDVAMVFQGFALYPHLTVRDNLAFPLKMRRVPRAERDRTIDETAALLGLSPLLARFPGELSGGERQRVAMGRAIVRRPRVFLFDEPLSNLDAALRTTLRLELSKLLAKLSATALYVTHDQVEAMTLGNRIAVLREGKLEQVARPEVIYEAPATTFVAGFFGAPPMTLLDARRLEGRRAVAGPLRLDLPGGIEAPELVVGVRPEHVTVEHASAERPESAPVAGFTARVASIEPLGAESHLELDAEGAVFRARVPGFRAPAVGASVTAYVDVRRLHWFDAATGKRLEPATP